MVNRLHAPEFATAHQSRHGCLPSSPAVATHLDGVQEYEMLMKKVLVSALLAVGAIGAVATPLTSFAQVDIRLNYGPPAPRYEVIPEPRAGYVWSGGHWQWQNNRHVWIGGNWQRERSGYAYSQPRWVEREGGGGWNYRASRWDRDGDGVPNNQDRRPNDPTRR
jgi:hypothetical protein